MKGIKHIIISNRFVKYDFDICRNITIVRGNSGTGKTTLYTLVSQYMANGEQSGVNLSSPCPCVVLEGSFWQIQLEQIRASIVFIDEGAKFLNSRDFAKSIRESDNYYVIFTREDLHQLPYSVDEIYEIKTSGKFHRFKKIYDTQLKTRCFGECPKAIDVIITEDSKSGYEFICGSMAEEHRRILAAGANSAIFEMLKAQINSTVFVMADGAAFGAEIDRIVKLIQSNHHVTLFLPESFEWLILRSGLIENVRDELEHPSEFVESEKYFSWERFFTALLTDRTKHTYLEYQKRQLNEHYLNDRERNAIFAIFPKNIPYRK